MGVFSEYGSAILKIGKAKGKPNLLSKSALGNPWEDENHAVTPILLILIRKAHHDIEPICPEVTLDEPIHEEHLENNVDETEALAEPKAEGIVVVLLEFKNEARHFTKNFTCTAQIIIAIFGLAISQAALTVTVPQ